MLIVEPFKSNSYGGVAKTPAGAWEREVYSLRKSCSIKVHGDYFIGLICQVKGEFS